MNGTGPHFEEEEDDEAVSTLSFESFDSVYYFLIGLSYIGSNSDWIRYSDFSLGNKPPFDFEVIYGFALVFTVVE